MPWPSVLLLAGLLLIAGSSFAADPSSSANPSPATSQSAWFLDVTESSGLPSLRYAEGVNLYDLDGDGLPEAFLTVARGRDRLFQNLGGCRFRDVTDERGVSSSGGMGAAFGDLDKDGRADLYVVRGEHVPGDNTLYVQQPGGTFVDQSAAAGAPGRRNGMAALLADLDGDGALDLLTSGSSFTTLYRNAGKPGSPAFTEGTARSGIAEKGRGWGLLATDFDGDGRPDLVLAQGAPGSAGGVKLYRNRGDGTFEDWTARSGVSGISWAMGAVSADFDGDGEFDLFVTNFDGPDRLYRNDGGGTFTDITAPSGIGSGHSVGASAGSVDGDLLPDLVVAQFQGPVRLYRNLGGGRFSEVGAPESGLGPFKRNDGIAFADVDGDGDLDLYVTNFEGKNRLYRNALPAGRSLKILPTADGAQPIGAVARLYAAGGLGKPEGLRATAELQANYGLLSQGPLEIIFRLPDDGTYDLTLTYPDGTVVERRAVRPGVLTLGSRKAP
jgi:hypothetical protein